MSINIKLHKNDLPDDLDLGNLIAVDGEFMGLNVRRDPLCLIQISSGNSDAHIIQFDRKNYNAPNLTKLLADENTTKIFHYGRADIAHIKYYLNTETNNIQLHKNDLPDDLDLGNLIAVDGEFMGLNVRRDPLCLIQIS